jgi:hypothetical protein
VGDTLDSNRGRRAFPKNKTDLLRRPKGDAMFAIARKALEDMAAKTQISGYLGAVKTKAKFCRGFGIFQYDLQHFKEDPNYFLNRQWSNFDACLRKCINELRAQLQRIGYGGKPRLTDEEMVHVTIAYNSGRFNPKKGLKQGYYDGEKYYGEWIFTYLSLSKNVPTPEGSSASTSNTTSHTDTAPQPFSETGQLYQVETRVSPLNLRDTPKVTSSNIITRLPRGHIVRVVSNQKISGFLEVETVLRGFAYAKYLKRTDATDKPSETEVTTSVSLNIPEVYAPHSAGAITLRSMPADAHSLNESRQPSRKGTTADEKKAELAKIIAWLAVDNPSHKRFKPTGRKTFCNIYAHDYCHLAGVYVPRVWWSHAAIEKLTHGLTVEPKLGSTIVEQRANDMYRWLNDYGERFGWRRAETVCALQDEVNQGAVGLIVARRKEESKSGHIVAVVPETAKHHALRNTAREVIIPLQSQAGVINFRYRTSRTRWWLHERCAESAFWFHR